jgi:transposase-like protein
MIKKKWVKAVYIKEMYCDVCGEKMEKSGLMLTSFPPQIEYICKKCGYTETVWSNEGIGELHYEFDNEEIV